MRKAILMMLLAAVSSSAVAEWELITSSDSTTFYADPSTIRKFGVTHKMWSLYDHKTIQSGRGVEQFLSSKDLSEYDCQQERRRTLYFTNHSGKMGGGEVVFTGSDPSNWVPVAPESVAATLWKFACGKR